MDYMLKSSDERVIIREIVCSDNQRVIDVRKSLKQKEVGFVL